MIKQTATALGLAAALTLGLAGAAGADTPTTTPTAPATHRFTCDDARTRAEHLHARLDAAGDRIARAEARRDKLREEHRDQLADALTTRIDAGKAHVGRVKTRLDRLEGAITDRCAAR
jgi:hypothetical protein